MWTRPRVSVALTSLVRTDVEMKRRLATTGALRAVQIFPHDSGSACRRMLTRRDSTPQSCSVVMPSCQAVRGRPRITRRAVFGHAVSQYEAVGLRGLL